MSATSTDSPQLATRRSFLMLGRLIWEQRGGIGLGVLAGLLWSAGKISVPLLVRQAIDTGIGSGQLGVIARWALYVACAGLVSATFTGFRRYKAFQEGRRCERRLRQRMFEHIERLHFGFHDRTQTGQLMSRANTDLQQIHMLITLVPLTVSNFVIVACTTIILASIDPVLTLLALGPLPLVNVLGRRFGERLHPAVRGLQEETAQLASVVEETVSGVRIIKGFGAEASQHRRLRTEADDVYGMAMLAARVRSTHLPAIELLPNLGLIFVLAYGGHLVLKGELSIGTLIMFNFFVILLINPLRMLGQIIAGAQRAAAAAERVERILSEDPAIVDPKQPLALPPKHADHPVGEVQLRGVRFAYASNHGHSVLSELDLTLHAGETVALVGGTGSGKSTVARLIPRFYDVSAGKVTLDGVDVRELPLSTLRSEVGIVFEDTFLFNDTIAANIGFARPRATPDEIERAARLAGAHDFIRDLPDAYETLIGERGFTLSGGQRQRIAIARAVLKDPRVLILDDATSAVDPGKEQEIRAAMTEVMRDRTTLIIAHRPQTLALANRVLLLDDGRVVAEGRHADLLATHPRYRQVLAQEDRAA